MSKFIIRGRTELKGEIEAAGNKNAALPIIAATALTEENCILQNVPQIRDVEAMLQLLEELGKDFKWLDETTVEISGSLKSSSLDRPAASKFRASILFASPLLALYGETEFPPPGGCVIGRRRLDSNLEVFEAFGAREDFDGYKYKLRMSAQREKFIFLKEASVTATENAMLLGAVMNEEFTIYNAAGEPHVEDLAIVLNKMGANVKGAGTNKIIIKGNSNLKGFEHSIVPDHIEVGTFAVAAAATKGNLVIHNAIENHLQMTLHHLRKMNVEFTLNDNKLIIRKSELKCGSHKVQVGPWPGFPTDLMSPFIVLATQTEGVTLCHDWMFESRMFFVDKLIVMGAEITQCDPHRVLIYGKSNLRGQSLSSPDIRAGIALVIAAMAAYGESEIDHVELIDRGYMKIDKRLNLLGADITRIE